MSTMTGRIVSLAFGLYDDVDESWTDDGKTYVTVALDGSPRFVLGRPVTLTRSLDRDELIEFLNSPQHAPDGTHSQADGSCSECPWPLYALPPDRIADAVIAHLLGGAS